MTWADWFDQFAFFLVGGITLLGAVGVVFAPRIIHACLCLLVALIGVAGLYGLMAAHLLLGIQLLVYAGGIAVLILFAIMLLHRRDESGILGGTRNLIIGLPATVIVWFVVAAAVIFSKWHYLPGGGTVSPPAGSNVRIIGELLLSRHLLAFELVSVVMLMALIGAIIIAREDKSTDSGQWAVDSGQETAEQQTEVSGGNAQ